VSPPALDVRGVSKVFLSAGKGPVEALRDIHLTIADGEFVGIVGASGSGKSTLLRIVDGLMPATTGEVLASGRVVTAPGPDRSMVFQQDCLLPWKSVLDNVAYGLLVAGKGKAAAREVARRFLAMVGLSAFEGYYPHQLSGGMRQRVNVARALAVDPRILLMDEPFAALDSQTREVMQAELLRIWSSSRKTVLLITHQIDEAVFLSDRVVVFTARPGTVREEIGVPFRRPRELALKRSPEFVAVVDHIWRLIEGEVRAALERPA
jgi:NitT/TauT family transport system ATP-binding protein